MATSRKYSHRPRRTAPTPLSATFTNALTIENHFSFVNAVGIVAL
jgi:hypothetical protein